MRSLLAIALVACVAPRPFVPTRVYVVAPCAREKHEEMSSGINIATLRNEPMTDEERAAYCEPRDYQPLVACGGGTLMRFDGCRWSCRPLFELIEQPPAHIDLDFNGYHAEGAAR